MNQEEKKLEFIKENHPKLYALLEKEVPNAIEDISNIDQHDRLLYNFWMSSYFVKLGDLDSRHSLLI